MLYGAARVDDADLASRGRSEAVARWGYLLNGGSVLSPDSFSQMSDYRNNYGLGAMEMTANPEDPGIGHLWSYLHDSAGLTADVRAGIVIAVLVPSRNCCTRVSKTISALREVVEVVVR